MGQGVRRLGEGHGFGGALMLGAPFVDQSTRRQSNLVTPVAFDVVVGATSTDIYAGASDRSFLVRSLAVVNPTGGGITATITVNGNQWYTASAGANSITRITSIEGVLIDPGVDIAATGQNLRIVGWGVRISGSAEWVL